MLNVFWLKRARETKDNDAEDATISPDSADETQQSKRGKQTGTQLANPILLPRELC
jgi:hypothetical protein